VRYPAVSRDVIDPFDSVPATAGRQGQDFSSLEHAGIGSSSTRNYPLIFVMPADPEPICSVALDVGERTVVRIADADRPNFANFLEVERRQSRIGKPETISFTSVTTNRFGKLSVRFPESTVR